MINTEAMVSTWSKVRYADKGRQMKSTKSLQIPLSWPGCPDIITRDQAHGTMLTVPPLSHEIDWGPNSITLELLLEGNYEWSELSHTAKLLLEHCKRETNGPLIAEKILKTE
eukprot:6107083-Ditylum_brightwellii.AAC.1